MASAMDLTGRHALICGASKGIGRATALALDTGNAEEAVRRLGEQLAIMAAELQPQT